MDLESPTVQDLKRELTLVMCVDILQWIHKARAIDSHGYTNISVDIMPLIAWYDRLDARAKHVFFECNENTVLKAAFGYEDKCLEFCSFHSLN